MIAHAKVFEHAKIYNSSGMNIIPIHCDGTKKPVVRWKNYINSAFPWWQLNQFLWGSAAKGLAVVCGASSHNHEVLDFDDGSTFEPWREIVRASLGEDFLQSLVVVATPRDGGGRHVHYRTINQEVGCAQALTVEGKVRIETRGHGQYALLPGSPLRCHETGNPYRLTQGDFAKLVTVTDNQRWQMLEAARSFNLWEPPEDDEVEWGGSLADGERPGDLFNNEASWSDILEDHGWHYVGGNLWRRPGKNIGVSAGVCVGPKGQEVFHVFSTSCSPLEAGESYEKFTLWTILNFDGDFAEAASAAAYLQNEERARVRQERDDLATQITSN